MTIKNKQARSRKERKAFIVAMLNRFLPEAPDPLIQRLAFLIGFQDRQAGLMP